MGNGGRGAVKTQLKIATSMISGRRSSEDGLREGKPKLNSDTSSRDAGVDGCGIDSGAKYKISNTRRPSGRINCDQGCDRAATVVAVVASWLAL